MKRNLFLAIALYSSISISPAKQPIAQQPVVHDLVYEGCHFTMTDPYDGRLTLSTGGGTTANYHAVINPKASRPFETWIQFDCHNNFKWSELLNLSGGGLARIDDKWVIAFKNAKAVNMKLYTLHGKNWEGAGTTADQMDRDEDKRSRSFVFCLVHGSQALCGLDDTVMYLQHPKESVLPQIIKLLESIEFIDDPVKQATPASSASP